MRIVFSPAAGDRGAELIRQVGTCRACKKKNIVWLVRGHIITLSTLTCEYCGAQDVAKKKQKASDTGIQWRPETDCWVGRVMGKNYPEMAKKGDLVR